jgi:hypothetical protein
LRRGHWRFQLIVCGAAIAAAARTAQWSAALALLDSAHAAGPFRCAHESTWGPETNGKEVEINHQQLHLTKKIEIVHIILRVDSNCHHCYLHSDNDNNTNIH